MAETMTTHCDGCQGSGRGGRGWLGWCHCLRVVRLWRPSHLGDQGDHGDHGGNGDHGGKDHNDGHDHPTWRAHRQDVMANIVIMVMIMRSHRLEVVRLPPLNQLQLHRASNRSLPFGASFCFYSSLCQPCLVGNSAWQAHPHGQSCFYHTGLLIIGQEVRSDSKFLGQGNGKSDLEADWKNQVCKIGKC